MKKRVKVLVATFITSALFSYPVTPPANAADLFSFNSLTFTNCTKTGNTGPTLAQCKAVATYLAQSWTTDNRYFNVINGIQYWTVPKDGIYSIAAAGASGGAVSTYIPGYGSTVQGEFTLMQGAILAILVGQQGLVSNTAGGGGGSFVLSVSSQGDTSTATPLVIGGGGGGSVHTYGATGNNIYTNANESSTVNALGLAGTCSTWQGCTSSNLFLTNSAIAGSGGFAGIQATSYGAAGGGGLNGSGQNNPSLNYANGGKSFFAGGAGGSTSTGGSGGFGGGGAGEFSATCGGGGGGGYSGGGGGIWCGTGGGAGSFNNGTNKVNVSGNNLGMGFVTVTYLSAWTPPMITSTSFPNVATFRATATLSVTVNTNGKVSFFAAGKSIAGCKSIAVTNTNGGTVSCNWRPSMRGSVAVSANFVSGAYRDAVSAIPVAVSTRSGLR